MGQDARGQGFRAGVAGGGIDAADVGTGVGEDGDGGDFHGLPVHRTSQLAPPLDLGDVVPLDAVADRDGRDCAIHDPLRDRRGIGGRGRSDPSEALATSDPGSAGQNGAHHGFQPPRPVRVQERSACLQAIRLNGAGRDDQFLVIFTASS